MMDIFIQSAMDKYLDACRNEQRACEVSPKQTEECFELLSEYLLHFSDLFQDPEDFSESAMEEWETALEHYVEQLFEGDTEHLPDLGGLPLSALDAGHLRDFMGWFVRRLPGMDSLVVEAFGKVLEDWVCFLFEKHCLSAEGYANNLHILSEVFPEAVRVTKAAHLLLFHVRLGSGVSPRLRGKKFSDFIEGHARIDHVDASPNQCDIWLKFDNLDHEGDRPIGPVHLPKEMKDFLVPGDVLDIEMGYRGDQWTIVDIGPVYPALVYVEADILDIPEKII